MSMPTSRRNPNHARGFTLIELMIVIVVVAILASIAWPSYSDSVRKSRRGQAKADLLEVAQLAERFRTVNGTYTGFAVPAVLTQSPRTGNGIARYDVAVATTASTFSLTATPRAGGGQDKDTKCLELSLTQAGVKGATGPDGADCW
jgi:type IV pilus assembly protein PilE